MEEYKLSDEVIGQVAKLVQLAIITGTDVIDHLRMIRVTSSELDDSTLVLTPEYREVSENQVSQLLEEVSQIQDAEEDERQAD